MPFHYTEKFARLYSRLSLPRRVRAFMCAAPALRQAGFPGAPLEDPALLDVFTIAFNNAYIIGQQIRLLEKNLADPYSYAVIDNSTRADERKAIEKICAQHNVTYLALPANPFRENPSASHGLALNWAYRNYIRPRAAHYWGCIDHDIFPVRRMQIIPELHHSGVYGFIQERNEKWYLWPGLCFFQRSITEKADVDFMPAHGLDTGGGNWPTLFAQLDRSKIPALKHDYIRVRDGENRQSDYFQLIGDWLHMINGSNWAEVESKDEFIDRVVEQLTQ